MHGHNFIIFSQVTEQTWYHTSAYHLSALVNLGPFLVKRGVHCCWLCVFSWLKLFENLQLLDSSESGYEALCELFLHRQQFR